MRLLKYDLPKKQINFLMCDFYFSELIIFKVKQYGIGVRHFISSAKKSYCYLNPFYAY